MDRLPRALAAGLALVASLARADPSYDADEPAEAASAAASAAPAASEPAPAKPTPRPLIGLTGILLAPNDPPPQLARAGTGIGAKRRASLKLEPVPRLPTPRSREFGTQLEADVIGAQWNLALGFDRSAQAVAAARPTDLTYDWQLRRRLYSDLDVGVLGGGDMGPWERLRPVKEHPYRYGLALYGLPRRDGGGFGWEASYSSGPAFGKDGYLFTGAVKYGF